MCAVRCLPIILEYCGGPSTDALHERLSAWNPAHTIRVLDNASPACRAACVTDQNLVNSFIGGGIKDCLALAKKEACRYVLIVMNDLELLTPLDISSFEEILEADPGMVQIGPALTDDSPQARVYPWMARLTRNQIRRVPHCDLLCCMLRLDFIEAFCNFPDSKGGWGYDLEIAYQALERLKTVAICDWSLARHRGESRRSRMALGSDFDKLMEMEQVYGQRFRDSPQILNAAWDQMRVAGLSSLWVGEQPGADWGGLAGPTGWRFKQFTTFPGQDSRTLETHRSMPSPVESALAYTKAGISVIPISPNKGTASDGTQDTPFDCTEYIRQRITTPDELREWFASGGQFGLAAVHGRVSGGLECLELVYSAVVKLFQQLVTFQGGAPLLEELPTLQEPVDGRTRLYYRCPNPVSGDRRLAQFELPSEPERLRVQLLALVHGEGSWTVLPGSPAACGDFNEVYEWVGRDLSTVPTITEDERSLLLESASCLNAWVDPNAILAPAGPEEFDSRVSWEQILVPLRWRKVKDCGEVALWHTPERTKPGYCAVSGIGFNRDLLYMIRTGKAYTKFGAFASFYFDGDFEKASSVRLRPAPPSRWDTAVGTRYMRAVRSTPSPLVSCIMPTTGDRRRFLPQAIKCFQRQTYPNSELVILCDGEDDVSDLIPADDGRIHYCYLGRDRQTLGAKLNSGCERARGELIAHFDDDDWSHPDRLSFQVGALLAEGAEFCGLSVILFYVIASGEALLSQTPALLHPSLWHVLPAGATFLYRHEFWSRSPFPDLRVGPDMAFIHAEGRQDHAVMVSDCRLYVAMIHGCNTDDYSRNSSSSYWVAWPGDLREVMGADIDFYRCLRQS
jgi:Glycosyl transferase family 2/Bifunctional DNA primase/polymerase, N-terminal